MRLSRCEVRDPINYRKSDRWPSSILRSLAAAEIANALRLRDFRSPAIFEFFNTIFPIADGSAPCPHVSFVAISAASHPFSCSGCRI